MKPTHTHKLISLFLALAMVFSLACPAFAAELDTTEDDGDALVSSDAAASDSEDWDTLPVSDSSEEEADDSSAEEEAVEETEEEAESQEQQTAAEETEDTENAEAEAAAEEEEAAAAETETDAEEEVAVTGLSTEEGDTGIFALGEDDESWVYTLDEDGEVVFGFAYLEDDQQVLAANGYYLLPAGAIDVTQEETTKAYSFDAGIYYFDEDGIWQQELTKKTASVTLTTVEEEDGDLVAENTDSKVVTIASATVTETEDGYAISSNIEYFDGSFNSRYYYEGELYSGLFRFSSGGTLYLITNGVGKTFSGAMTSSVGTYICNYTLSTSYDGLYYYQGTVYSGLFRFSSGGKLYLITKGVGKAFSGAMTSSCGTYICNYTKSTSYDGLYYFEGSVYSGLFRFSSGGTLYVITNGVGSKFSGTMNTSHGTYICNYTKSTSYDGLYYKNGAVYTGFRSYNLYYYTKGKKDKTVNGWKTISGSEYYFTNGKAATGTKRIKRNGYTYTYTFRSNGKLVTDLFSYNSSYKKKKLHIVLARGSHTGTILAYNSSTGKYDIPVKSFVISMSRKSSNTKPGTYKLTTRKRWWKYSSKLWYQYATYVSGSGSWTHSEQYSKASIKALKYSSYNGLGTNQSKQCIRMQVVNCKLIYDLAKSNGSNTRVVITRGNGYLPFGKMTLSNNYDATGKVSSSQKYDPTDPAV